MHAMCRHVPVNVRALLVRFGLMGHLEGVVEAVPRCLIHRQMIGARATKRPENTFPRAWRQSDSRPKYRGYEGRNIPRYIWRPSAKRNFLVAEVTFEALQVAFIGHDGALCIDGCSNFVSQ